MAAIFIAAAVLKGHCVQLCASGMQSCHVLLAGQVTGGDLCTPMHMACQSVSQLQHRPSKLPYRHS